MNIQEIFKQAQQKIFRESEELKRLDKEIELLKATEKILSGKVLK